ncbi:hypothetical protein [Isoptericola sp. NPDC058082]|uniref:hypothetical protein n=1 Tax=Isoptericola sp. NPDC058082 TaxID=3346331 RepID=UPI0036E96F5C
MTTETTTAASAVEPTPDGHLPCAACGVAVAVEDAGERIQVGQSSRYRVSPLDAEPSERGKPYRVTEPGDMTRCPSCADRLALARLLVEAHPGAVRRIGSPAVATERVVAALDGLAALGAPLPDAAKLTGAKLGRLVNRLTLHGGIVQWASHRRGQPSPAAEVTTAPWAHVTDNADLRDDYAGYLSDAIGPRPTPPPDGGPRGCLMCGVAQQTGTWEQVNVRASTLGMKQQGDPRVSGYLCTGCGTAVQDVGSVGPTALSRALLAHLGVAHNPLNPIQVDGVEMWFATGRPPTRTRWAHVALDADTRAVLGIE